MEYGIDRGGRTGCRLAAPPPIDRNDGCVILTVKKGTILGPRSGVGYSGVLGDSADRLPKRGMWQVR